MAMGDEVMTDPEQRTNLGRGLAALFGDESDDYANLDKVRASKTVPVELLRPNARQPRQHFDQAALAELADSIRRNGVLQPILVRRQSDNPTHYEIVAGERRWRAAQLAQLHEVPVIIKELDDRETLALALVENVQREDLTALEEAQTYRRLIDEFHYAQQDLGQAVGKSRSHIANSLRLLELPDDVKALLNEGKITAGHARALLAVADPSAVAKEVVRKGLNVRQTEALGQTRKPKPAGPGKAAPADAGHAQSDRKGTAFKDADTLALERDLSALLGLKVNVEFTGQGGSITIHYRTLEQLDDVLHRLHHPGGADFSGR
jgi:ParB family chromosome partitioning protein